MLVRNYRLKFDSIWIIGFSEKDKKLLILYELLHIIRLTKEAYDFSDS